MQHCRCGAGKQAGRQAGRPRQGAEAQGDRAECARQARPLTLHSGRFEDDGEVRVSEYLRGAAHEGGGREAIGDAGGGVHATPIASASKCASETIGSDQWTIA
jgi:hypothetical protein